MVVPSSQPQTVRPGERTNADGKAIGNTILLAIPDEEFDVIRASLQFVEVAHHAVVYESRQKIEFAFFPNNGMVSLVFRTNGGYSVEIGVVGNEGFVPVQAAAGLRSSPYEAIMQISGGGFRMNIEAMEAALTTCPQLQTLMNRYAAVHGLQVAQTAGCNRLHDLEQRLSRWLLLTQDRVGSGLLKITHDFLATMLGTDRPSVTLAAGSLQKKNIIEYSHGSVRVLNRKKLESSACECYGVIQNYRAELAVK